MKKFFFLLLFSPLLIWAENVSQKKAEKFALDFLNSMVQSRNSSVSLKMVYNGLDASVSRSQTESAPFYVFNNTAGKGFVIISGEDAVMPVLGYSFENNFVANPLPVNVSGMFSDYIRQIQYLRNNGATATPAIKQAWGNSLDLEVGRDIVKHETAQWDQGSPYNDSCFVINGQRSVTGCTITAAATVMRFHKWPVRGHGSLPSYSYVDPIENKSHVVPGRQLGHTYDWDAMPLIYDESASIESKSQIARLMADLAVMFKAQAHPEGTGAFSINVAKTLPDYMNYSKSMRFISRETYGYKEWNEMLRKELETNGPVFYAGSEEDDENGHAFVLDGYTDKEYYSINFGWGGWDNGYYLLDALVNRGDFEFNFSFHQDAIVNFKKDEGELPIEDIRFCSDSYSYPISGLFTPEEVITANHPFTVYCNRLFNNGNRSYSYLDLALELVDKSGNVKEVICKSRYTSPFNEYSFHLFQLDNTVITTNIEPGDYIRLCYKQQMLPYEWIPVTGKDNESVYETIQLDDNVKLSANTSLDYDRNTKVLMLTSTKYKISAFAIDKNFSIPWMPFGEEKGRLVLDTKQLPDGIVCLTLVCGNRCRDIYIKK